MSDRDRLAELGQMVEHFDQTAAGRVTKGVSLKWDQFELYQDAARAHLSCLTSPTSEQVEAAAKAFHEFWFLDDQNPDDPEEFYPELWDEMEQEDRDWYLATARLHLEAALAAAKETNDEPLELPHSHGRRL